MMSQAMQDAKTPEELQAAVDDFFAPMEVEPGIFAEYDEDVCAWVYTDQDGITYHVRK